MREAARGDCSKAICMQIAKDGQLGWNSRNPVAKNINPSGIYPATLKAVSASCLCGPPRAEACYFLCLDTKKVTKEKSRITLITTAPPF